MIFSYGFGGSYRVGIPYAEELSVFTEQADLETEEIPDTYYFMWMDVGRAYFEPLIGYDIYEDIGAYDRDVLLIHGDADSIVPLSYSERALEVYPSARLEVISGAGHGFGGVDFARAMDYILEYLETNRV